MYVTPSEYKRFCSESLEKETLWTMRSSEKEHGPNCYEFAQTWFVFILIKTTYAFFYLFCVQYLLEHCVVEFNEFLTNKTELVLLGLVQPLPVPGYRASIAFILLKEPYLPYRLR